MIHANDDGSLKHISNVISLQHNGGVPITPVDKLFVCSFNKNRLASDVFGYLDKYRSCDFANTSNNLSKGIQHKPCFNSFAELVNQRIEYLAQRHDNLAILWSGGCDSCTMVTSLIVNQIDKSRYIIFCNNGAVLESPEFYQFILKSNLPIINIGDAPIYDFINAHGEYTYVNGCPEQIFSYPIQSVSAVNHFWKHWKDGIKDNLLENCSRWKTTVSNQELDEIVSVLDDYLSYLQLDKDVAYTIDYLWLLTFATHWNFIPCMFASFLSTESSYYRTHQDFYLTEAFACWALNRSLNHNPHYNWLTSKTRFDPAFYRIEEKQYIRQVFNHTEIDSKLKQGSQTRDHALYGLNPNTIAVYHTDGVFITDDKYRHEVNRLILKEQYEHLYNESMQ